MMAAFSANAFSTTSFRAARTFNQRGTETAACLSATSVKDDNINVLISRRKAIAEQTAFVFTAFASVYSGYLPDATALDMDAFINSEIAKDTKECNPKTDPKCRPSMSEDEALCKYGQSGQARGEACQRFRASGGALPASGTKEKSLGGAYAM